MKREENHTANIHFQTTSKNTPPLSLSLSLFCVYTLPPNAHTHKAQSIKLSSLFPLYCLTLYPNAKDTHTDTHTQTLFPYTHAHTQTHTHTHTHIHTHTHTHTHTNEYSLSLKRYLERLAVFLDVENFLQ